MELVSYIYLNSPEIVSLYCQLKGEDVIETLRAHDKKQRLAESNPEAVMKNVADANAKL